MQNTKDRTIIGKAFLLFIKYIASPIVKLIWVKNISGLEKLPKNGAYLIAANHQSYLDFITIMAVMPRRVIFLAAEKFFTNPVWRPLVEYSGQIKVEREAVDKSSSVAAALEKICQGQVIALFPQGTRSRDGEIGKTFTGVAKLALAAQVPVVPIGIKGAFTVWPSNRNPKFSKEVELILGKPMDLSEYYNQVGDKKIEREITNQVMQEISRLSGLKYNKE